MRGQGAWDAAVNSDFAKRLIRNVKELNAEHGQTKTPQFYRELGELTLDLINETYENVYDALPDDDDE